MISIKKTNKEPVNNTVGFDRASSFLILLLVFLAPVFFLPIFNISSEVSKSVLISTTVTVAFFLWLIARMKDGRFVFPRSIILGSSILVVIAAFFSSVFSKIPSVSFVGLGYEIGTFTSLLILFILMFLASIFFQKKERISQLYFSILFSAVIVFLYQVIRFIFLSINLSFANVFATLPENLIGKWADMAIFFGLVVVLSLIMLEVASIGKKTKSLLYTVLALSVVILVMVNMKLVWFVVGLFSLIVFVYAISFGKKRIEESGERKIPKTPFAVLLLSLFFILSGGVVGDFIYSSVNIPQEILRPTWGQTLEVAKSSLKENPVFGVGANRFSNIWLLFKPSEINKSLLWNVDFNTGVGLVPSLMITTGGIGVLAWLIFLAIFLYKGIRSVFLTNISPANHYITLSSFIASLYLWIFTIFYVPNITIVFLTFLMTGVFIASLVQTGINKNYDFSFLDDPRVGFASVLVLILLIISSITGGYLLFQKFLSVGYFQKSIVDFRIKNNINEAEKDINMAIRLSKEDVYYRTLADINLAKIGLILSQKNISKETIRTQTTAISRAAIQNAITATEIDSSNYLNWMTSANVYNTLMRLGAPKDFYKSASQSYKKASSLNPNSPFVVLAQAKLEVVSGNKEKAKSYIAQALNKKNNYTEAIFLLSQIQADEGNLKDAITSVEVASVVSPNDIGIFFQLGLLRYKNKDYAGAISAFARAVELNPNYSNAKYFLGLSYSKDGYRSKAVEQFEQILKLNPGNKDVEKIIRNIKNGKNPLSNNKEVDSMPIEEK